MLQLCGFATVGGGAGGVDFALIAVETGGHLRAAALRLLSELGDVAAASNSRPSKAAFVRRALAEFASSMCCGNAGVYARSMSRLLRVAGSAVQVGETVAMEEQRACVCRRGWNSALGFFAVQHALSRNLQCKSHVGAGKPFDCDADDRSYHHAMTPLQCRSMSLRPPGPAATLFVMDLLDDEDAILLAAPLPKPPSRARSPPPRPAAPWQSLPLPPPLGPLPAQTSAPRPPAPCGVSAPPFEPPPPPSPSLRRLVAR